MVLSDVTVSALEPVTPYALTTIVSVPSETLYARFPENPTPDASTTLDGFLISHSVVEGRPVEDITKTVCLPSVSMMPPLSWRYSILDSHLSKSLYDTPLPDAQSPTVGRLQPIMSEMSLTVSSIFCASAARS